MTNWHEKKLDELIDGLAAGVSVRSRDGDLSRPAVLKTSAVSGGKVDIRETKAVIAADVVRAKCPLVGDSIVISRMNTPALVGATGYVKTDEQGVFLPDRLWLARSRRGVGTDMRWLNYRLGFGDVAVGVRDLATGTSNSMKNIPKTSLLNLSLLAPPAHEQRAISAAIGSAEDLITSLERIITKKRAIKQGMIQQILGGIDAPSHPLSELGVTVRGVGYDPKRDLTAHRTHETVDLLRANNVQDARLDLGDIQFVHRRKVRADQRLHVGDVLICAANGSKRLVGKAAAISAVERDSTFGAFMMVYRPDETKVMPEYAALQFQTKTYRDWIELLLAGSSINNLRPTDVSSLPIRLPHRSEQERVVRIFEDIDGELRAIEARLEATRAVKQGMMQELLTGRTRLPVDEGVSV